MSRARGQPRPPPRKPPPHTPQALLMVLEGAAAAPPVGAGPSDWPALVADALTALQGPPRLVAAFRRWSELGAGARDEHLAAVRGFARACAAAASTATRTATTATGAPTATAAATGRAAGTSAATAAATATAAIRGRPRGGSASPRAALDAIDPLEQPIETLKGVGPSTGARLRGKGLTTVRDVVLLLPRRYEDLRAPLDASQPPVEGAFQLGHAQATVLSARVGFLRRGGRRLVARLRLDGGGEVELQLFQFAPAYGRRFQRGARLRFAGRLDARGDDPGRLWTTVHPQILFDDPLPPVPLVPPVPPVPPVAAVVAVAAGAAAPVVSVPAGAAVLPDAGAPKAVAGPALCALRPRYPDVPGVAARTVERIVRGAAERFAAQFVDPLGPELLARLGLPPLGEALRAVHTPPEDLPPEEVAAVAEGRHPVARRLAFEELLSLQLALGRARATARGARGIAFAGAAEAASGRSLAERLCALTGLTPTAGQRAALAQIAGDMAAPEPMIRLLQGDVGAGKTLVALGAALLALDAGYQVAIMVPTEILADQHFAALQDPLRRAGHVAGLLVGGSGRAAREALARGAVRLVVGTHALQEASVAFARLGLVIVDEQHRFGVDQRMRLVAKGEGGRPDLLVMTATPIPRTMAMAVYGDLDVSVVAERPPGWRPVSTTVYAESQREEVYAALEADVADGGRAYVICPVIDESEKVDLRAATATHAVLEARLRGRAGVALLHGRQSSGQKAASLAAFAAGAVQVLVSTTVVEVGIDVRAATMMVVESAERFGLSQLHQLRGRVGRPGSPRGRCLLVAGSGAEGAAARERLEAIARSADGFALAEADLALRGPGQLLGTRQAGLADLAFADLAIHGALLEAAREVARTFVEEDPALSRPEHAPLRALADRGERLLRAG
ncbi:MAG TPA: ATP-dependent DNA helicase RecG [Myxococcota bacterium]|jgi:ATP-dependent DNA helicase RecG|nr:ATP-dependent DNA helicase RecG [Myxococcota bacterium]